MKAHCNYAFFLSMMFGALSVANTIKLDFIDNKFEDFLIRLSLPESDEKEFTRYYSVICDQLKGNPEIKKRLAEGYLYKIALEGMEKKHPAWFKALHPFISDPRITLDTEINNVRMFIGGFLIRYGSYEEFLRKKIAKKEDGFFTTAWNSVKEFTVSAKNKLVSWCSWA